MAKTRVEGEVFSHRILWTTAKRMRDQAEAEPRGAMYFDMAAMLMAHLTVEAYCNFLLDVLYPATFAVERETFRSDIDAKVLWLSRQMDYALDLSRRPYQTVKALTRFRDRIVHAKPEVYADEYEHPVDQEPPFMESGELQNSVSLQSRARAMDDVSELCEGMHKKAIAIANHKPAPTPSQRGTGRSDTDAEHAHRFGLALFVCPLACNRRDLLIVTTKLLKRPIHGKHGMLWRGPSSRSLYSLGPTITCLSIQSFFPRSP